MFSGRRGATWLKYLGTFPLLASAGWLRSLMANDLMRCIVCSSFFFFCCLQHVALLLILGIERRFCDYLLEQNLFHAHPLTREVGWYDDHAAVPLLYWLDSVSSSSFFVLMILFHVRKAVCSGSFINLFVIQSMTDLDCYVCTQICQ